MDDEAERQSGRRGSFFTSTRRNDRENVRERDDAVWGRSETDTSEFRGFPESREYPTMPSMGITIGKREVESMIPEFNPDKDKTLSAEMWVEMLEDCCTQFGVTEAQKYIIATMRLKGPARACLEKSRGRVLTWATLKESLLTNFPDEVDELGILRKMEAPRKRDETVEAYVMGKYALGQRIGLSTRLMIKYIIMGVPGQMERQDLRTANPVTIPALMQCMNRLETDERPSRDRYRTRATYRRGDHHRSRERENRMRERHRDRRNRSRSPKRDRSRSREGRHKPNDRGRSRDRQHRDARKDEAVKTERKKPQSGQSGGSRSGNKSKRCFICNSDKHLAFKCPEKKDFRVRLVHERTASLSPLRKSLKQVEVEGRRLDALLDSGSDISLLQENVAKSMGLMKEGSAIQFSVYGGGRRETLWATSMRVKSGDEYCTIKIHVVPQHYQQFPLLLGRNFLKACERRGLKIIPTVEAISGTREDQMRSNVMQRRELKMEDLAIGHKGDDVAKDKLVRLVNKYRTCFALSSKELGHNAEFPMKISLKDNTKVVRYVPYRIPLRLQHKVDEALKELLDNNIIRKSTSEFASPMVALQKKNGDLRLCVDYRQLNSLIVKEHYPMPSVEEEVHKLQGKSVFSTVDLMMGYHQVAVDEQSKYITAFVTPSGQYEFNRVPFGLANSPAVFMRTMSHVLEPLKGDTLHCFVDDIIVATSSVEENLDVLEKLFAELVKHNLTLKLSKCKFFHSTINFLGHDIDGEHMSPGKVKVHAVEQFPQPQTQRNVRQFLGLAGYFRRFIPDFQKISLPLRELLRKPTGEKKQPLKTIVWGEEQEKAFREIKRLLTCEPLLALYNPEASHELHCDGSKLGIGSVLMQRVGDEPPRPVAYYSRAATDAESRYPSYEMETLAVVESMERFRYFLLGKQFKVVTDCSALQMTQNKKNLRDSVARWWIRMMVFDFVLEHRAGTAMNHADALSRCPVSLPSKKEDPWVRVIGVAQEDWVVARQLESPKLERIHAIVTGKLKGELDEKQIKKDFIVQENKLFRCTPKGNRLVVPPGLKFFVMRAAHDERGHPAEHRTIKNLERDFWFPKLSRLTKKYVKNCIKCAMHKASPDEKRFQWHVMQKKPIPFHTVHLDFCGPFPRTSGGKEHILAIVDAFTRFTILRPVARPTTLTAIKALDEISQYFGLPTIAVSDQGTAFTSHDFQEYCRKNHIQHSPVAVSTPRANGQVERIFKTVKESLRCLSEDEQGKDWAQHLATVQWAINSSVNRVTGETPYRLLLGFNPKNQRENLMTFAVTSAVERTDSAMEDLQDLRSKAEAKMAEHQRVEAEKHNLRTKKPTQFKEGNLVLVKYNPPATGGSKKMVPRYRGPYIVAEVIGRDRYLVKDTPATQVTRLPFEAIYAADRLKRCGIPEGLDELEEEMEVDLRDEDESE